MWLWKKIWVNEEALPTIYTANGGSSARYSLGRVVNSCRKSIKARPTQKGNRVRRFSTFFKCRGDYDCCWSCWSATFETLEHPSLLYGLCAGVEEWLRDAVRLLDVIEVPKRH